LTFACSSIWRYEDTLEEATRDPLTGLLNRRSFMREAKLALARQERGGTSSAVLMLDIDHFKRVNDTWGHQAGDEVIVAFAEEISSHVRKTDIAGRYGGEEFIVYLEDTDATGALQLAERIRSGIGARVFTFDGEELEVTTSGGIYCIPGALDANLSSAIDRADKALYEAKESGRNQVRLFNSEDPTRG
jgi:diguanylate cyclase (GGDEF)-like protein